MCSIHPGGCRRGRAGSPGSPGCPPEQQECPKTCPSWFPKHLGGAGTTSELQAGRQREGYGMRAKEIPKCVWKEEKQTQGQHSQSQGRAGRGGRVTEGILEDFPFKGSGREAILASASSPAAINSGMANSHSGSSATLLLSRLLSPSSSILKSLDPELRESSLLEKPRSAEPSAATATKDNRLTLGQKSMAGFSSRQPKLPTFLRRLEQFSNKMLRDNVEYLNAEITDGPGHAPASIGPSHPAQTGMERDLCNSQELREVLVPGTERLLPLEPPDPADSPENPGKQTKAPVGSAARGRRCRIPGARPGCRQVVLSTWEPGWGSC